MHLGEVPVGHTVSIVSLSSSSLVSQRLMSFGLLPGTRVTVVSIAPLGDPITVEAEGSRISIRKDDASCVVVDEGVHRG